MPIKRIGQEDVKLNHIRREIENTTLNSIRKILPDRAIQEACEGEGYTYRRRLLTPTVMILHMVMAAIWPEESFEASWQMIWDAMISRLPNAKGRAPWSGSISKARKRVPLAVWKHLFAWLSEKAQGLSMSLDKWRSHRIVLIDGTCISMPDEKALLKEFGTATSAGRKSKYPLARLVTVALGQSMTILGYALGSYTDSEISLGLPLISMLKKDDLLIGDRHFAAAHYYAKYLETGLHFLTRAHQNLKISNIKRLWSYSATDFVGELRINEKHLKLDASLPRLVRVRFIQALIRTRGAWKKEWFATSFLDEKEYPAEELVALYARRWRIESLLRNVKIELSADVLRSKTVDGVRKEVCARLMALNIIRMIMIDAGQKHKVDPFRLSFVHTVRCILAFAPALANEPEWKLPEIYEAMLTEIASHFVLYRPGRNEPRAVRRERVHYPCLRTTRAQWRLDHVA